ncbi:MAG: response regulator [Kordiimonadaceae bacterium]|jgi:CheY-like chemotaxis protein|nr:response regulator [Kordiimonadaceae bacterium]MBT6032770.1 response regulator [Kordiimonadaceae bacterium]
MAKILVVDDDEDMRDLITFRLENAGHDITSAEDGVVGMKLARKIKPDLILMDLFMPRIDGFDVVRDLRQFGNKTPIIALTAEQSDRGKKKAIKAGCNEVMHKPITTCFEQQIELFIEKYCE